MIREYFENLSSKKLEKSMRNGQIPKCTCAAKIEPRGYKTLQQNYDKQ
jgi:hypothetical protein